MNFFVTFGLENSLLRERPPFLKHPVNHEVLIKEVNTLHSEKQNKGKLPEQWKKSIIVPTYNTHNKTNSSNY
jgi:hypothetical protein